jgi:hypothetical protein
LTPQRSGSQWQSSIQVAFQDNDGAGAVPQQIPEEPDATSSVGSFFDVPQPVQELSLHQQIMRRFAERKPFLRSAFYNELSALHTKMDLFNEFEANQKKTFKLGAKTELLLNQHDSKSPQMKVKGSATPSQLS